MNFDTFDYKKVGQSAGIVVYCGVQDGRWCWEVPHHTQGDRWLPARRSPRRFLSEREAWINACQVNNLDTENLIRYEAHVLGFVALCILLFWAFNTWGNQ
jgi:hypothetical protein